MSTHTNELIRLHVSAVVPIMIMDLERHGGPSDYDRERVSGHSQILGEQGDILLYRSSKKGETAKVMNVLCECLAIMAFTPGGIKFAGLHFTDELPYVRLIEEKSNAGTENV